MRSLLDLLRSAIEELRRFLADPVGYIQELRVRRRRWKLVKAYAEVGRRRHGLGPGFTPLMYAYGQLDHEGLATLTEDGLDWHWPEGVDS